MTNKEALQSLSNLDLPLLHDKVLLDNGIDVSVNYTVENKDIIELCSAYVYQVEITHPDFTEGKLKIALSRKELIIRMNSIFDKNGLPKEKSQLNAEIFIETI